MNPACPRSQGLRQLAIEMWMPLAWALNMLDRSMVRDELYPFVLPPLSARQDAVAAVAQVHCRLVHIWPVIRTFHATQELRRSACCMG